jgi:hypothetical protein
MRRRRDHLKCHTDEREAPDETKEGPAPGAAQNSQRERRIGARDKKKYRAGSMVRNTRLALPAGRAWDKVEDRLKNYRGSREDARSSD